MIMLDWMIYINQQFDLFFKAGVLRVEWKIYQSPALGVTEMIRDNCYDNISIALNSKYVEMIISFLLTYSIDMACHVPCITSTFHSSFATFWIETFNFHTFLYPSKWMPGLCDVKMNRNKKTPFLEKDIIGLLCDRVLQTR